LSVLHTSVCVVLQVFGFDFPTKSFRAHNLAYPQLDFGCDTVKI
jgi:hypothetical protein